MILHCVTQFKLGHHLSGFDVPQFGRFITAGGKQLLTVGTPSHTVYTTCVRRTAHLSYQVGGGAVVQENFTVKTGWGKKVSWRRIADGLDKTRMFLWKKKYQITYCLNFDDNIHPLFTRVLFLTYYYCYVQFLVSGECVFQILF